MLQSLLILFAAVGSTLTAVFLASILIHRRNALRAESRRGLFLYSDGHRTRAIDPIEAIMALEADPEFRFDLHPKRADEGDQEAVQIIARAVRSVFRVPEFSEPGKPGLTVVECYRLLQAFAIYAEALKKNIRVSPTSAPSTESMPIACSESTTNDSSPSGSNVDAPA